MVSNATRRLVRQRARSLCEYCHSTEYLSPDRFTIDHIMSQSLGGSDEPDNLALNLPL
ncbi:MAG: HNH endonuclease signature motif containing protein [Cyanobacteriota bacterium]